jgi:hypothetical protein
MERNEACSILKKAFANEVNKTTKTLRMIKGERTQQTVCVCAKRADYTSKGHK